MNEQEKMAEVQKISFDNGNTSLLSFARPDTQVNDLLNSLGIAPPKVLIWLVGSATRLESEAKPYLIELFSRGITCAALEKDAVILDGGTQFGVMALMGRALADQDCHATLLGVAPDALARYPGKPDVSNMKDAADLDPNHTHFVLTPGKEWGSETRWMRGLASALVGGEASPPVPVTGENNKAGTTPPKCKAVMVLAGGRLESIARKEVLEAVRLDWPIVVIDGSGELADQISHYVRDPRGLSKIPAIVEIVEEGDLHIYSLKGSPAGFKELILRHLGENELLQQSWARFGRYDAQANKYQRNFLGLEKWILSLAVATTLLVILDTIFKGALPNLAVSAGVGDWLSRYLLGGLYVVIVFLPILTSSLLAFTTMLNPGNKWVLLRSSAESIKSAIYLYRTRPETVFRQTQPQVEQRAKDHNERIRRVRDHANREAELSRRIEAISHQLMQSDVNLAALPVYVDKIPPKYSTHEGDDGLSPLTPEQYIRLRLDHQVTWMLGKTIKLERELRLYQGLVIAFGGLGTFLAAIRQELWVALSTSVVAALTTYLKLKTTENTLMQYNQTAADLENVKGWWEALPPEERVKSVNVDRLVTTTERILASESIGWMQQMQDALVALREGQEGAAGDSDQLPPKKQQISAGQNEDEDSEEASSEESVIEVTIEEPLDENQRESQPTDGKPNHRVAHPK
jgi:hypothetical protein